MAGNHELPEIKIYSNSAGQAVLSFIFPDFNLIFTPTVCKLLIIREVKIDSEEAPSKCSSSNVDRNFTNFLSEFNFRRETPNYF